MDSGEARVLVVGAGGLGCPATLALARAGVRRMTLIDPDRVDPTNLHRQLWHQEADVGRPKVDSAKEKLEARFPGLRVEAVAGRVDAGNAVELFEAHALVLDGVDGVETKFLLSDAAVKARRPLVYGGVLRFEGLAMLIAPGGPCLRCLFEEPPERGTTPTCAQAGVLGSVAGVIGGLQAELALAALRGEGQPGRLRIFDGQKLRWRSLRVPKLPGCRVCSLPPEEISLPRGFAVECAG